MSRGPIGRPNDLDQKKKQSPWLWIAILILVVTAGGLWYKFSLKDQTIDQTGGVERLDPINSGEYQAVFLDNGQVYFGKLKQKSDFFSLTDVYYLQSGTGSLDQTSSLSLSKLGNEAHGPEDKMEINKDHILFIEDMKPDSKVVKAIQDYKSKNK